MQVNDPQNEEEINVLFHAIDSSYSLAKCPITNCCIGMVLKTGYDTSKGKLIRKVIANAESLNIEQKDGLWIILFLLVCSLYTSYYVLTEGMKNAERSK